MNSISWEQLVIREPRLEQLRCRARSAAGGDAREWSILKRDMDRLVGWDSNRSDELASAEARDVAYRHILAAFERRVKTALGRSR